MKPLILGLVDIPPGWGAGGGRGLCSDLEFENMGLWAAKKQNKPKAKTNTKTKQNLALGFLKPLPAMARFSEDRRKRTRGEDAAARTPAGTVM